MINQPSCLSYCADSRCRTIFIRPTMSAILLLHAYISRCKETHKILFSTNTIFNRKLWIIHDLVLGRQAVDGT